jgi:hypothetical protein
MRHEVGRSREFWVRSLLLICRPVLTNQQLNWRLQVNARFEMLHLNERVGDLSLVDPAHLRFQRIKLAGSGGDEHFSFS